MNQILCCGFGIIVWRGEPGLQALQQSMPSSYMEPLHTQLQMVLLQTLNSSLYQQQRVLGRVLGPARGSGNEMAQWILEANGRVVPRRSLRPLNVDEVHSPVEIKMREVFDELIQRR